jgi:predicted RNase H-like nuclease (RuvC/YqgF family)
MDIIKILGGIKNTIIICLCLFLGYQAYTLGSAGKKALKQHYEYQLKQQAGITKLNGILTELADKNQELVLKLEEKEQKVYEMRMDIGKSIKRLNTKVKDIKKIEDAKESYKALAKAWDGE